MINFRNILFALSSFGSTLVLTGCKMAVLDPKGMIAADEKKLLIDAVLLMLIIVVPVIIATFTIVIRYRASNTKAKYSPHWAHSTILEAGWWGLPIVIIAILATMTWRTTHQLDPYKPLNVAAKSMTIEVIALEWRWLFIYPEQHIATMNFVEFPVNTPVTFLITADAPMNSFQIPQLGGQIYAMSGMQTKLHLISNQIGDYNGRSVSFSGDGFANMTFIARAASDADFNAWVKSVKQSKNALTMTTYNQLIAPSKQHDTLYYSSVADNLFNDIVMKFMMPMKNTKAPDSSAEPEKEYQHHKPYIATSHISQ